MQYYYTKETKTGSNLLVLYKVSVKGSAPEISIKAEN